MLIHCTSWSVWLIFICDIIVVIVRMSASRQPSAYASSSLRPCSEQWLGLPCKLWGGQNFAAFSDDTFVRFHRWGSGPGGTWSAAVLRLFLLVMSLLHVCTNCLMHWSLRTTQSQCHILDHGCIGAHYGHRQGQGQAKARPPQGQGQG